MRLENDVNDAIDIDIGHVSEQAARWWMAILAPGQGWKAVVSRDNEGNSLCLSPWSTVLDEKPRFRVRMMGDWPSCPTPTEPPSPPSSQQALEFLVGFCALHGVHSQLFAAFTTAMTFPTHNFYRTPATLPRPTMSNSSGALKVPTVNMNEIYEQLPYYMALSCNHHVIVSSLCGVF